MKLIMGVVPCKDRFFLDKALTVVKPGMEEVIGLTQGENSYYGVVTELYAGTMQLSMGYIDTENVPDVREQLTVMSRVTSDNPAENYVGFAIFQLWQTSLHVFQAFILPQFRDGVILGQAFQKIEAQARLLGAPYLSLCTRERALVEKLGFTETYSTYRKRL